MLHVSFHDRAGRHLASREFPGSRDGLRLQYRSLVEAAVACRAARILLAHNHPSGDHTPSAADIAATAALAGFLAQIEIELADHLVVAGDRVTSMLAAGLIFPLTAPPAPPSSRTD